MGYQKVEEAKKCREKLKEYFKAYIKEPDSTRLNSGQLKFAEGLLIGNLALNNVKRMRGTSAFYEYVDQYILGSRDDIIRYFDVKKNCEALHEWILSNVWKNSQKTRTKQDELEDQKIFLDWADEIGVQDSLIREIFY